MAKKAKQESQAEQSERFRRLVQGMVDAGDLSHTANSDAALDRAVDQLDLKKPAGS